MDRVKRKFVVSPDSHRLFLFFFFPMPMEETEAILASQNLVNKSGVYGPLEYDFSVRLLDGKTVVRLAFC